MNAGMGEFLRARRARMSPAEAGLKEGFRRRRVPGLRREEVAELAGLSVDYYMRLEQGRAANPSPSVLDAVARALRLDNDERHHLYDLARQPAMAEETDEAHDDIDAVLLRLLAGLAGQPALILTPAMNVVAANNAARALFGPLVTAGGNVLRHAFTDARVRDRTPNWEEVATEAVASLRVQAARYPADNEIAGLIEELHAGSPDFARLWTRHDARERGTTPVNVTHPEVGIVALTNIWLSPPASPRRTLVVYTAEPGSPSADRLSRLVETSGDQAVERTT